MGREPGRERVGGSFNPSRGPQAQGYGARGRAARGAGSMAGHGAPATGQSDAQRAGDLVAALFGPRATRQLSDAQRAARAWYAANGDREREHTTGVWLRKPGRAGADPVMVVRLDSNLLAQELGTNKDLYLARLSTAGVRVSDLRFLVGRAKEPRAAKTPARPRAEKTPPRELTPIERARIADATKDLPDGLRASVERAMRATLLRRAAGE